MDLRLADYRDHLLRLRFRRRKEPRAEPGGWEHGLAHVHGPIIPGASPAGASPPHALEHGDEGKDAPGLDEDERRLIGRRVLEQDGGEAQRRRSEEHTSELQSLRHLVCRLLLEKKNNT